MKHLFKVTLCLVTALYLLGGHWGILQVVAWSQMLRDYSKEKGLVVAVKETFDGEHPCPMCLKIKEGRADEQQSKAPVNVNKADQNSFWFADILEVKLPGDDWSYIGNESVLRTEILGASQWRAMPPIPPPRCGAV